MAVEAITYRTCEKRSALRTVVVEDVCNTVVLLPTGSLDVVTATLLEGTTSRHSFWAEALATDPADHQFICPADQLVARRPIQIAVKVKSRKH